MSNPNRKFEIDDLTNRPGLYFNPQTEVLVVVDDSVEIDREIFNLEEFEGADWVMISEEVPVDEERSDALVEAFQTRYHPGGEKSVASASTSDGDGPDDEDGDSQDVGRE